MDILCLFERDGFERPLPSKISSAIFQIRQVSLYS